MSRVFLVEDVANNLKKGFCSDGGTLEPYL